MSLVFFSGFAKHNARKKGVPSEALTKEMGVFSRVSEKKCGSKPTWNTESWRHARKSILSTFQRGYKNQTPTETVR